MHLTPVGHNANGRTRLYIHGDNAALNHSASEGCVILPRDIRLRIAHSRDHTIEVVR
jgi:hypothetical protein